MTGPVHKLPIAGDRTEVRGRPLSVGVDGHGEPCVWFVPDPGLRTDVLTIMTGSDDVPVGARFLGTLTTPRGMVLHSWAIGPDPVAFLDDLVALYRRHGLALGHEDGHGAFRIQPLSHHLVQWVREAHVEGVRP